MQPRELALDCLVERTVSDRDRTKFARLAAQLLLDLLEDRARRLAPALECNFRRRQQLRLIVVQVTRDSGALLVDCGKHSERELAHQSAAPRGVPLHHPVRCDWSQPRDNRLRPRCGRAPIARGQRDRAGLERDTYVRANEQSVFERLFCVIGDSRVAIAPARNHDTAPETFPKRAVSLTQIEFLQPRRRCGQRQRAAFRGRNHPLVEAGPARHQFAEAAIWRPSIFPTCTIASISRALSATRSIDSIEPCAARARFIPYPAAASP